MAGACLVSLPVCALTPLSPVWQCLGDRCRSMPLSLTSMRGDLPSLQPEVLNSTLIDCRYQIEVLAKIDWAPDVGVRQRETQHRV